MPAMGWLSLLLRGGMWLLGKIWPAKDERDIERTAGEKIGQQETQNANAQAGLNEVQNAVQARDENRAAVAADPGRLRDGTDPAAAAYRPGAD